MKNLIVGAVAFLLIGVWLATFSDPIAESFGNYELERSATSTTAIELSQRIVEGDQSFLLLDVRRADSNRSVEIDSATPIHYEEFETQELMTSFSRDKEILIIDENGKNAMRVSGYFEKHGFRSSFVKDGFEGWVTMVLNPPRPATNATEREFSAYRERIAISNFLQGKGVGVGVERVKRKKKVFKRVIRAAGDGGC